MIDRADQLSITLQCDLLGINRSSFYYLPIPESKENLTIMQKLDEQYIKTPFWGTAYQKTSTLGILWNLLKLSLNIGEKSKKLNRMINNYYDACVEGFDTDNLRPELPKEALDSIMESYHLKQRFLPAKGYQLNNQGLNFEKRSNLEAKVAAIIGICCFGFSLTFLSDNLNGNVIGLSKIVPNNIGIILFIIGIICIFFYIRKRFS